MADLRLILKLRLIHHEADRDDARRAYQACDKNTIEYEMAKLNYSSAVVRINEVLTIINYLDEKQA